MNPEHLQQLCADFGLGVPGHIDELAEGVLNQNYILTTDTGRYFIKSVREKKKASISYIAAVEEYMKVHEIPAVGMLRTVDGELYAQYRHEVYTVYLFLNHTCVSAYTLEDYSVMGALLGKIHRAGSDGVPRELQAVQFAEKESQEILKRLEDYNVQILAKTVRDSTDDLFLDYIHLKLAVIPELERVSLPNDTLIHGDYHAENLLFNKDHSILGVCDWEKAEMAPRVYELARSVHYICFDGNREGGNDGPEDEVACSQSFIRGYREIYPISTEEIMKGFDLRLRKLALSVWIEESYYGRGDVRSNKFVENEMRLIREFSKKGFVESFASVIA